MPVKLVEPPIVVRGRGSSVDMTEVRALAEQSERGWATIDGDTYTDKKKASTAAARWKRHVSTLNDDRKVRTRIWQEGNKWVWAVRSEEPTK